jgi:hypothetical protein
MLDDIRRAEDWLTAALRRSPPDRGLATLVSPLADRRRLAAMLASLLDDPVRRRAAAARSYEHPLGFDKLILLSSPASELHLHIWWPDTERLVEDVHNHRFDFASTILDGALDMARYTVGRDGVTMCAYQEALGSAVGRIRLHRTGEAQLSRVGTAAMTAGTVYAMSADELHRINAAGSGLTATLFLRGPQIRGATAVFSDHPPADRPDPSRPPMRPAAFADRIDAFRERLLLHGNGARRPAKA